MFIGATNIVIRAQSILNEKRFFNPRKKAKTFFNFLSENIC